VTVYALLWELLKHALHGRGRDEVHVLVEDGPYVELVGGPARYFSWTDDRDRFCVIQAVRG
jgi:hypothetical protein